MSERKLSYYEHVATQTCNDECQKIIMQLTSEVRKLDADARYLAERMGENECHISSLGPDCPNYEDRNLEECRDCWREVARKAIHDK